MAEVPRPTIRGRRLGSELRRLREAAQKSTDDAASILKCSRAKISRVETGHTGIRRLDLGILLDFYEVANAETRQGLEDLARESKKRGWWHDYGDTIPPAYADYLGLEEEARYIRTWEPILVPGLLQTEGYARAILDANPAITRLGDPDSFVKIRADRKGILTKESPVRLSVIIWEPVLHCVVGGEEVHREQLRHLVEMGQMSNVTIQVVPLSVGATAGTCGAFVLFSFADSPVPGAVFLETLTSSQYLEEAKELDGYGMVFDWLRSSALDPEQSLNTIAALAAAKLK